MTRNRWQVLAFLFVSFLPSWAFAGQDKIATDLHAADPTSTVDVIMQFKELPTEADHRKLREHGGTLKSELPLVKGALYSVPAYALRALSEDPQIVYLSPDRGVSGTLDYVTAAVSAPTAW